MLYDTSKDKQSNSVKILSFLIFVALVAMFVIWINPWQKPQVNIGSLLDECQTKMSDSGLKYIVCCADRSGNLKECSKYGIFYQNEYVATLIDIQALTPYENYHACIFSTPLGSNSTHNPIINNEEVYCTRAFNKDEYRIIFTAGYVNSTGNITIVKLYIMPELGFTNNFDYSNNLDNGTLILNITGKALS